MEEINREEVVKLLVKAKQRIQYLSATYKETTCIEEICDFLKRVCDHEKCTDSFDLDPDRSISLEFCPKCETVFSSSA